MEEWTMRRLSPLFAFLFVVPLLGSDSPKEYDDKAEIVGIEGTWRFSELEHNGEKVDLVTRWVTTYRGGTYTTNYGHGDTVRGCYRIDPTRNPPHLDRLPSSGPCKGETNKFIYQIDGDTLRVAGFYLIELPRPQGFNDDDISIWTYKRVK
jgi:uncharacterized protein (TIGR03067 family)